MDWNIEIRVSPDEIATFGRDAAIARATRNAWHNAVNDARPKHSLALSAPPEERTSRAYGTPDLLLRFSFEVS